MQRYKLTFRTLAGVLSIILVFAGAAPATAGCGTDCACDHSAACSHDFQGTPRSHDRMEHGYAAFLEQHGYAFTLSVHLLAAACIETISSGYCEYHRVPLTQALKGPATAPNRYGRFFTPAFTGCPDHGFGEYSLLSRAARTDLPGKNAPAVALYLQHLSLLI